MFQHLNDDALDQEVGRAAALIAAAQAHLGRLLVEVDRRELWHTDGTTNILEWAQTRCGYERRTARTVIETAEALQALPVTAATLASGAASLDQVAAAVTIDHPDEDLAELARTRHPATLRRMAARPRDPVPAETRRFTWGWVQSGAALRLSGRLPADEGQYVAAALDRLRDQVPPDSETGRFQPHEQRGADALVELASLSLGVDADPDRATVVIHVDTNVLTAETEQGMRLPESTLDRILCDSTTQTAIEGDSGTVGIGRRSRVVPHALRRALHRRDTTCRFPGCERTRWTHAHHIREWVRDEGPTDLDNLVRLCGHHHRVIHRGWQIDGDPNAHLVWVRPDGRPLTVGTGALEPHLRERYVGTGPAP